MTVPLNKEPNRPNRVCVCVCVCAHELVWVICKGQIPSLSYRVTFTSFFFQFHVLVFIFCVIMQKLWTMGFVLVILQSILMLKISRRLHKSLQFKFIN